jgi:hypothetical protein
LINEIEIKLLWIGKDESVHDDKIALDNLTFSERGRRNEQLGFLTCLYL